MACAKLQEEVISTQGIELGVAEKSYVDAQAKENKLHNPSKLLYKKHQKIKKLNKLKYRQEKKLEYLKNRLETQTNQLENMQKEKGE